MHTRIIILFLIVCFAFFLRIFDLDSIPISLHGDEVGVGYNAYTLATSGLDEYGKKFPLVFRADVGPIIFYFTAIFVGLFGLTEFTTRLPSVVIGTITIIVFYWFVNELLLFFTNIKNSTKRYSLSHARPKIALISCLFLSISPWHIQISRITHDASYGFLLQIIGMSLLFMYSRIRRVTLIYSSIVLFGVSFYAYHAPRLTSPMLFLIILYYLKVKISVYRKGLLIFLAIIFPLFLDFISKPLGSTRFGGIHIFIGETFYLSTLISLPIKMVLNFLNQFNIVGLFFDSSSLRYFNVHNVGLLYMYYIPCIFLSIYFLKHFRSFLKFVFVLLVVSVLPGALTSGPMNAGRVLLLLPLLDILAAIGMYQFYISKGHRLQYFMVTSAILIISVGVFLHQYFNDSPLRFAKLWQYGAKEVAQFAVAHEAQVDHIIITDQLKQVYIYVLFYGKKDPKSYVGYPTTHTHSFVGFTSFGKYEFRAIKWDSDQKNPNTLIIGTKDEIPPSEAQTSIRSPSGEILYSMRTND